MAAWTTANFTPLRGKGSKAVPLDLFLLDLTRDGEQQKTTTPEQRLANIAAVTGAEVIDLSQPLWDAAGE